MDGVSDGGSKSPPKGEDRVLTEGDEAIVEVLDAVEVEGVMAGGGISVLTVDATGVLPIDSPLAFFLASNLFRALARACASVSSTA